MKNKQKNIYDINRNIRFFIAWFLYLYLFKVQFNNSVSIIGNIVGSVHTYIFIMGWNSTMACKQQFDWIIKTGCDLIGQKINYLNTNVNNKRKSVSGMQYIHLSCWLFIKRQTSGTSSDNKWQQVTTSDTTSDNEGQRVTTNGNEWQRVTEVVQWMKMAQYTLKNGWLPSFQWQKEITTTSRDGWLQLEWLNK